MAHQGKQVMARFEYTLKKLLMFRLPVQEKVCYLDVDMLCLNPLTGIEQMHHLTAAPDLGTDGEPNEVFNGPMLNSGFVVYQPSPEFADELVDYYLNSDEEFNFGDQQVTSAFLHDRHPSQLHWADVSWNTLKRRKFAPGGIGLVRGQIVAPGRTEAVGNILRAG